MDDSFKIQMFQDGEEVVLCDVQSGKELVLGGIKPPKAKEWDQDKTYMQRPVGEQFRPPPPKGPQTKQGAGRQ
jgi:hypothetical protein